MQERTTQLLRSLDYTNQELADYCGVSLGMIKQIKRGTRSPSQGLAQKIDDFVRQKIEHLEGLLRQEAGSE